MSLPENGLKWTKKNIFSPLSVRLKISQNDEYPYYFG